MTLFLKKGINKAKDQYIYPHPSQKGTGNCAAYAGAACLYAFGLDHESKLIPDAPDADADKKFQYQISRMVERLSDLIYAKGKANEKGIAEGYRKYINEVGLNCKFDVTEQPLTVYEYDHLAGQSKYVTNLLHILDELKRCQDIIPLIKWKGSDGEEKRHAVGLVGVDEGTGELVLNNPWGDAYHTNPVDAGHNTEQGKTSDAFTRHKFSVDGDGTVHIPFAGTDAQIFAFLMICPAPEHALAVNSESKTLTFPREPQTPLDAPHQGAYRRFAYAVTNRQPDFINGLAVELPGLCPENVVAMGAPAGWKAALWYREREPGFDRLAPEVVLDPMAMTFAGVLWRSEATGIEQQGELGGFFVDLEYPLRCMRQGGPGEWHDDPLGHGIALHEREGRTTAWHVSATTPARREGTRSIVTERNSPRG